MKKAQRVQRRMTPAEKQEHGRLTALAERDKSELMALGKTLKRQHRRKLGPLLSALREARQESGLSLNDLTEKTGMDRASLSRLFSANANPTLATLERVAKAMNKKLVVQLHSVD